MNQEPRRFALDAEGKLVEVFPQNCKPSQENKDYQEPKEGEIIGLRGNNLTQPEEECIWQNGKEVWRKLK